MVKGPLNSVATEVIGSGGEESYNQREGSIDEALSG